MAQYANPQQFGAPMGEHNNDGGYMEQDEEWEREGLLDPAWEKQQRKVSSKDTLQCSIEANKYSAVIIVRWCHLLPPFLLLGVLKKLHSIEWRKLEIARTSDIGLEKHINLDFIIAVFLLSCTPCYYSMLQLSH